MIGKQITCAVAMLALVAAGAAAEGDSSPEGRRLSPEGRVPAISLVSQPNISLVSQPNISLVSQPRLSVAAGDSFESRGFDRGRPFDDRRDPGHSRFFLDLDRDRHRHSSFSFYLSLPYGGYSSRYYRGPYLWLPPYPESYVYVYREPVYVPEPKGYVVLETPSVTGGTGAAGRAPGGVPQQAPAGKAEGGVYRSELAKALGGKDVVGAAFALGESRLKTGEYAEAVSAFQQALDENSDDAAARVGLALALSGQGQYEAAAHMLRRGLAGLKDWKSARLDLRVALGGEAYDAALKRLQDAAEGGPARADTQLLLGFHLYLQGQYAQAAKTLWAAYDAGVNDPLLKEMLLAAERRLGGPEQKADGT